LKSTEIPKREFYFIKECREIIQAYIEQEKLDQEVKRGLYKADPLLVQICPQITEDNCIKKD